MPESVRSCQSQAAGELQHDVPGRDVKLPIVNLDVGVSTENDHELKPRLALGTKLSTG